MGGITDGLTAVVGTATYEVLWGVYAAQSAARCKLGALWEYPLLGVSRSSFELKGATTRSGKHTAWYSVRLPASLEQLEGELRRCFEGRRATSQMASTFVDLSYEVVSDLSGDAGDCLRAARFIASEGHLSDASEDRLQAPPWWRALEMQRHDPAYEAAVETQYYETRAFYDLTRAIHTFYTTSPPPDRVGSPATDTGWKNRVTRADVGEAVRRGLLFDSVTTLGDDPDNDSAASAGDEDDEMGSGSNASTKAASRSRGI
ncbi:MAG: hypothetical protein SGPRY_009980 [Prymnesium sp.]